MTYINENIKLLFVCYLFTFILYFINYWYNGTSSYTIVYCDWKIVVYVAAKATYIRFLHGKIGILEGFFGPSSVHRGRTQIVLG